MRRYDNSAWGKVEGACGEGYYGELKLRHRLRMTSHNQHPAS